MDTNKYDQQAADFLNAAGVTFAANLIREGAMFGDDDTTVRDIYTVTFARADKPERSFAVEFGQALAHSRRWVNAQCRGYDWHLPCRFHTNSRHHSKCPAARYTVQPPTAYDVLACLTKDYPGSFADFCGEFGYDTDSRKALDTYMRVQEEYAKVRGFFTDDELEQLRDIQ